MFQPKLGASEYGEGMFLNRPAAGKDLLATEEPLFCMQHSANRRFVCACAHCGAFCGGISGQLEALFSDAEDVMVLGMIAEFAPQWQSDTIKSSVCRCAKGCGE